MGKTSYAAVNRYKAKAYDRLEVIVPKGEKEIIKAHADKTGESVNAFIRRAIQETMIRDTLDLKE